MKKVKRIESENQNAKKVKVENKHRRGSKKVVYKQNYDPPPCKWGPGLRAFLSKVWEVSRYSLLKLLNCDILIEIALPNRIYVKKLQKSTTTVRRRWDIAIFLVVSN